MVGLRQSTDPTTPQPTGGPSPERPTSGAPAALMEALAAEHAAIFAYGPIGAKLDEDLAEFARDAEAAHRARRDALVLALTADGADPPAAEPSYALPFPVSGTADALRLAVQIEERVAAVWRAALRAGAGVTRAGALDALVDAAVRATTWRRSAGITPATVPFPGDP